MQLVGGLEAPMHLDDEWVVHPREDVTLRAGILQMLRFTQVCLTKNFHCIYAFRFVLFEASVDRSKGTATNFLFEDVIAQRVRF